MKPQLCLPVPEEGTGGESAYWVIRIWLRRRAARLAPEGTLSLLPTAFIPWKLLGARRVREQVHLFDLSALDGKLANEAVMDVHDPTYETVLEQIPEFRRMRTLSPLYHAVEVEVGDNGVVLTCRDLRTRNFNTRFGELTVTLDCSRNAPGRPLSCLETNAALPVSASGGGTA